MDNYEFLGRIYWLLKLVQTWLNWFMDSSQNLLTYKKNHTSKMITGNIGFPYVYEIEA